MSQRRALVTGGSRGIGAAIVQALLADDWQVHAPARAELDLADPESVTAFLNLNAEVIYDGLVLNAAINEPAPLGELTAETWDRTLKTNLSSAFSLASALAPKMAERGFGRIAAISSAYSQRARPGRAAYSATKAALDSLIRSLAVEFGARGVLANGIAPGFVDTELTRQNNDEAAIAQLVSRIPVGRLAASEEIAQAVAMLMSAKNTYITGQTLMVDGGFSCT
ncbi:MAG: SDR family NAD(P)-dependent oxidoreductase [Actinomycetota bacterium]|nr:SDR family NAD(P)-dependent oxidoreductase [Actinomycetota bacterium]MDP2287963.1 SDR family NAD(P)-dependent oxidoreductase [Actinomycetota bacterium]